MDNANTIILLKGTAFIDKRYYDNFSKGDTIYGLNYSPEELKRWDISEIEDAKSELKKYRCEYYKRPEAFEIEEYALEYCFCDDEGNFIEGSDYDLAEEK